MVAILLTAAVVANPSGIQFVEDDYPAALAQARKEHKPVLVDTWASWCHTCLSMKRQKTPDAARECVQLGLREMDPAARTSVATDLIGTADGCADQLPEDDPQVKELRQKSLAWLEKLIADPDAALSVDDRSDAQ